MVSTQLMPKRRSTWSAWNYLTASDGPRANVGSVSLCVPLLFCSLRSYSRSLQDLLDEPPSVDPSLRPRSSPRHSQPAF